MTTPEDDKENVIYLSDFMDMRAERMKDEAAVESRPLRVTFKGPIAEAIRKEAEMSGEDLSKTMIDFVSFGVEQRRLLREGYEGPSYKKPTELSGILGRLSIWFGLNESHITLSRPGENSSNRHGDSDDNA